MSAEPYVMEPHSWTKLGGKAANKLPWQFCQKCGLVRLRNPFSEWASKMGCNNEDHPQHEVWRRKVGGVRGSPK